MDKNYNDVGSAQHYQRDRIDTMHKLEAIWGTYQVMTYCEMSAFCYRMRAGRKVGNDATQDLIKAEWFEVRAEFLKKKFSDKNNPQLPIEGIRKSGDNISVPIEEDFLTMLEDNKSQL